VGIVTDDPRVPSFASNRVAYVDGVPIAALKADEVTWFSRPDAELVEEIGRIFGQPADRAPVSTLSDAVV
jgi:hypothetical protein